MQEATKNFPKQIVSSQNLIEILAARNFFFISVNGKRGIQSTNVFPSSNMEFI